MKNFSVGGFLRKSLVAMGFATGLSVAQAQQLGQENYAPNEDPNATAATLVQENTRNSFSRTLVALNENSGAVTVGKPIKDERVLTVDEANFLQKFDLNGDGKVSAEDIEKKFSVSLSKFVPLYKGDLSVLDGESEIMAMFDAAQSLSENRAAAKTEEERRELDGKLKSLYAKIEDAKLRLSIQYFEKLKNDFEKSFASSGDRLLFLSHMEKDDKLASFHDFVLNSLDQIQKDVKYRAFADRSYVTLDSTSTNIYKVEADIPEGKVSQEESDAYASSFIATKDVLNIRTLAPYVTESNVFEFLSDLNNDGKLDDGDNGIFSGKQLSEMFTTMEASMLKNGKEKDFYTNLSYVFALAGYDAKISNKTELTKLLTTDPLAKVHFVKGLSRLAISGTDLSYVLRDGEKGVGNWAKQKEKIMANPYIGKIMKKLLDGTTNLDKELEKLRAQGLITDKAYDKALKDLEATVIAPGFEEKMLGQVLSLLSAFTASYMSEKGGLSGAHFSFSNQSLAPMNEVMKKFSDSFDTNLGIYNTKEGSMLMLGLSYRGEMKLNDTESMNFLVGTNVGLGKDNNILPILGIGYVNNTNSEALEKAGIVKFDETKKFFGLNARYSMINALSGSAGFGFSFSEDKRAAILAKRTQYAKLLDSVMEYDGNASLAEYLKTLETRLSAPENEKVAFLSASLPAFAIQLKSLDTLKDTRAKRALIEEQKAYLLSSFTDYQARKESDKGYGVSAWGLGANILLRVVTKGLPIIPSLEVSKITVNYAGNQMKETVSSLLSRD